MSETLEPEFEPITHISLDWISFAFSYSAITYKTNRSSDAKLLQVCQNKDSKTRTTFPFMVLSCKNSTDFFKSMAEKFKNDEVFHFLSILSDRVCPVSKS